MGEVLKRDTGIRMDHVPFRGAAPLVTELLSGRIQFGGDQLSSSLERVRTGQLKALAVATKSVALPNVPTVRALGYPNLELQGWNGFSRPRARRSRSSRVCNRRLPRPWPIPTSKSA
jgi:tripartite-type tricarboxylate transporter receptor subunit TctC